MADLKSATKVKIALERDVKYAAGKRSGDEETLDRLNQANELLSV